MKESERFNLAKFIFESNRIEGIDGLTLEDLLAHTKFLAQPMLSTAAIEEFVEAVAKARLRVGKGMNVQVGRHVPPPGGPNILAALTRIVQRTNDYGYAHPYPVHVAYESLHPFMDGNGRSGRALWLWMMLKKNFPVVDSSFLRTFYYQALEAGEAEWPK